MAIDVPTVLMTPDAMVKMNYYRASDMRTTIHTLCTPSDQAYQFLEATQYNFDDLIMIYVQGATPSTNVLRGELRFVVEVVP